MLNKLFRYRTGRQRPPAPQFAGLSIRKLPLDTRGSRSHGLLVDEGDLAIARMLHSRDLGTASVPFPQVAVYKGIGSTNDFQKLCLQSALDFTGLLLPDRFQRGHKPELPVRLTP